MKASELRIGNYVQTVQGVFHVTAICGGTIPEVFICPFLTQEPFVVNLDQVNPIHLTGDWLISRGIESVSLSRKVIKSKYEISLRYELFINGKSVGSIRVYHNIELKYVHQLQNLYFALTGEELPLKQHAI